MSAAVQVSGFTVALPSTLLVDAVLWRRALTEKIHNISQNLQRRKTRGSSHNSSLDMSLSKSNAVISIPGLAFEKQAVVIFSQSLVVIFF